MSRAQACIYELEQINPAVAQEILEQGACKDRITISTCDYPDLSKYLEQSYAGDLRRVLEEKQVLFNSLKLGANYEDRDKILASGRVVMENTEIPEFGAKKYSWTLKPETFKNILEVVNAKY